jgi:hypothetical protein
MLFYKVRSEHKKNHVSRLDKAECRMNAETQPQLPTLHCYKHHKERATAQTTVYEISVWSNSEW